MRRILWSFSTLFLAVLALLLASGLLNSLISLRLAYAHVDASIIGLVMSGYYGGLVIGAFVVPKIIRKVGHIRSFAAFAAVGTISVLCYALFFSPLLWAFLRLITGMAMMGLYMVIESWLNEQTEANFRGRIFSVYMAISFLGLGSGQFLLMIGNQTGQTLFLLAAMLFAFSLIPVTLSGAVYPKPVKNARIHLKRVIHLSPFGIWGCLIAGLVNGAFYALGPVFALNQGLAHTSVAVWMGVTILSGLVLQWPIGALSDHFPRQRVIGLLGLAVAGVSLWLIYLHTSSLIYSLIVAGLFGGLSFTIYPVSVAHANDRLDPDEIVATSGTLILTYGLGAALGPMGAALVTAIISAQGLFYFIALASVLLGALALLLPRRVPLTAKQQDHFVPTPRNATVIAELDPRAEE